MDYQSVWYCLIYITTMQLTDWSMQYLLPNLSALALAPSCRAWGQHRTEPLMHEVAPILPQKKDKGIVLVSLPISCSLV